MSAYLVGQAVEHKAADTNTESLPCLQSAWVAPQRQIAAAERDFLGSQLQTATERHAQLADTVELLRSQLLQVPSPLSNCFILGVG